MKARDLAALAALGVAGYAAYDKFGRKKDEDNKDEAPKLRGKLGSSKSANDDTEGEYRGNMLGQGRSANEGDAGEAEARMSKRSRQENDVPDRIMGKDAAGSRFTDRAAADEVIPERKGNGKGAVSAVVNKLRTAEDSNSASNALAAQKAADAKAAKAAAAAAQSDSSTGGVGRRSLESAPASAAPAPSQFTLPGTQSSMGALSRATRPSGSAAPATPAASGNAAMGAFSQVKAVPRNIQYATEAEKARQARIDEQNYDSDLMKNRRQAVVDTLQNIPSGIANIFKPPEKVFQNKTYFNPMTNKVEKYKKGGVVKKMASGGLASSKMSKPSGASRGDGIAQRGRTRGTLR